MKIQNLKPFEEDKFLKHKQSWSFSSNKFWEMSFPTSQMKIIVSDSTLLYSGNHSSDFFYLLIPF